VNQEYELTFRAKDVIHSAYFPHLRAQMNTVPGLTTRMKFIPTITTSDMRERKKNASFNYVLMCNKICGGAHYKMKMIVVIDTPEQYAAWMKSKTTFKDEFLKVATPAVETPMVADSTKMAKL
jgi:cytochrome c oxidase subunit 2